MAAESRIPLPPRVAANIPACGTRPSNRCPKRGDGGAGPRQDGVPFDAGVVHCCRQHIRLLMELDDALLAEIDRRAGSRNRSDNIRRAVAAALMNRDAGA